MAGHDLIVLGASAGGVEAVSALLAGLPPDLAAAVCVVIHQRPDVESRLPRVLSRKTMLPVVVARQGARITPGTVYVAPPDLHLFVECDERGGVLRLARGPRENRARPAVDPLFRSAALAFGPRVIGVILSGALDDGTGGLWTVKDRGGIAVVQDPDDAAVPSMPQSALTEVEVDHVAPARELGPLLGRLAREVAPSELADRISASSHEPTDELEREIAITTLDDSRHDDSARYGVPSRFACPDCGGVLWDLSAEGPMRYRCEVGHAHTAATLGEAQTEVVEEALWTALRALEDKIELSRRRGAQAAERGLDGFVSQFAIEEEAARQNAAALRVILRLDGRVGIRPHRAERADETIGEAKAEAADATGVTSAADAEAGVEPTEVAQTAEG